MRYEQKVYTFNDILNDYNDCLMWMEKLGVNTDRSRLPVYEKLFRLISNIKIPEYKEMIAKQKAQEIWNALYEVYSFVFVYKAFRGNEVEGLTERLQSAKSGPEEYIHENGNSNHSRNTIYELLVASTLINMNYEVDFATEADIKTKIDNIPTYIECKRPQNSKRLEERYREGISQLQRRLNNNKTEECFGLLFISLDKILNSEFKCPEFPDKGTFDKHLFDIGKSVFQKEVINKVKPKSDDSLAKFILPIQKTFLQCH